MSAFKKEGCSGGKVCFLQSFLYPGKKVEKDGPYIKIDLQSHHDPFGSQQKSGEKEEAVQYANMKQISLCQTSFPMTVMNGT